MKLNDALGGILTYKLLGEDCVRGSGLPHCVVRPCALTEEPEGADLVVDQGDTIKGKISREDVASLAVAAALGEVGEAIDATFEVGTTQPFSEPFVQPEAGFAPRTGEDWGRALAAANVRPGVTGKTVGGIYTGSLTEEEALTAAPAGEGAAQEAERPLTDAWYSW